MTNIRLCILCILCIFVPSFVHSLLHIPFCRTVRCYETCRHVRYGPISPTDDPAFSHGPFNPTSHSDTFTTRQKQDFESVIRQLLSIRDPQFIPSLLTRNMDLMMSVVMKDSLSVTSEALKEKFDALISDCLVNINDNGSLDDNQISILTAEITDLLVTCMEEFVEQTSRVDENHKHFLGVILKTLSNKKYSAHEREDALDDLLRKKRDNLTAGFLRHVQSECERIQNASTMTPESARLLELMRTIQVRIVEELGEDLGEAAQVLGQLIGYDNKLERLAVLDAGLAVRGPRFANELLELTEEALAGFNRVAGGADIELVICVETIKERLQQYLLSNGHVH